MALSWVAEARVYVSAAQQQGPEQGAEQRAEQGGHSAAQRTCWRSASCRGRGGCPPSGQRACAPGAAAWPRPGGCPARSCLQRGRAGQAGLEARPEGAPFGLAATGSSPAQPPTNWQFRPRQHSMKASYPYIAIKRKRPFCLFSARPHHARAGRACTPARRHPPASSFTEVSSCLGGSASSASGVRRASGTPLASRSLGVA